MSISLMHMAGMNSTISDFAPPSSTVGNTYAESSSDFMDYSLYYNLDNHITVSACTYKTIGKEILPVLYSLFFTVGFLGNILVLWVILRGVRLRSMTDVCLLNLSLADLLLVCSLPFLAHQARHQWVFGEGMCTLVLSVYHIGFYSGIFFIALMSFDRYLAVVHAVHAMKFRTRSFGALASVIIWFGAILASFPEILFVKVNTFNGENICSTFYGNEKKTQKVFAIFEMNILGFIIPSGIMAFCYSKILQRLFTIRSPRKQAMRLVVLVMVVFFCCWTPYNITSFFYGFELLNIYSSCESSTIIRLSLQITEVVAYSHSCLNPFLYVFVGDKFKRHLLKLINKCPFIRLQNMSSHSTTSVTSRSTIVDERATNI